MTARTFIYRTLVNNPGVTSLVGGAANPRVFAKKTMTSAVEEMPFIVYKLGVESNLDIAEDERLVRQYLQVWVHDVDSEDHADYMRIDEVLSAVKESLHLASSISDGVISSEFIETSQDFNDDTLNTLFKYSRFTLIRNDRS